MEKKLEQLFNENYLVICDTNVFLRLYDYSPEFSEFALNCLKSIQEKLRIPYTTFLEYNKRYREKYGNSKRKIEKYNSNLLPSIDSFEAKISNEFERIQQYDFPDMLELHSAVMKKITEIKNAISNYSSNHELLVAVNEEFLKTDKIKMFWDTLNGQILPQFDYSTIYNICNEGEERFKNNTPPGFKDKDKGGLRQFCDLILWKEILTFSLLNKVNILFVTDDVKVDWWETKTDEDGNSKKVFHQKLIDEFNSFTKNKIIAVTSASLFNQISGEFHIEKQNTVEMALNHTAEAYVEAIKDDVFEEIQDDLIYSETDFIVGFNHIGSEGLSEFEVEDYNCVRFDIEDYDDESITYLLTFYIKLSATSCEYWGRDDDTKEVITSPPNNHIFEGLLNVRVDRSVENFVDLMHERKFDKALIESCELEEISFEETFEPDIDDMYDICPRCGRKITFEEDAGNGFCRQCSEESDEI